MDDLDLEALHGFKLQDGKLAAYYRLIPDEAEVHLGRVIVASEFRKGGLGREFVTEALKQAREHYPGLPVHIQAQAYLEKFYASFEFEPISEVYLEDGIPHLDMLLKK